MTRKSAKVSKSPKRPASDRRRWAHHQLYGQVPLVLAASVGSDGKVYESWQYDPLYRPRLPRGAVAGDVTKQIFCAACHVPKYFYVDETHRCVQCDERFTFRASEQKYWYEVRKFNFRSAPVRCPTCRRLRRSEHALREQIAQARRAVETSPHDPGAHLALARSVVEYHERTGAGRLDDALAAARKARTLWPDAPDAELWEGIAHAREGRARQARVCLSRFLERANGRFADLESKARTYLAHSAA